VYHNPKSVPEDALLDIRLNRSLRVASFQKNIRSEKARGARRGKTMGPEFKIDVGETPEARIISEDETHAVIAVMVDKAWLARNIHFLAALADRALAPPSAPFA
jgi:hypothetical protein